MSEELQRAEDELARARAALRRARAYVPQAFTPHGKRRAIQLMAAREAHLLGLVASVLTLRAAVCDKGEGVTTAALEQVIAPQRATTPAVPSAPRVVWTPPRVDVSYIAEKRMRAKLDERVRDLVVQSQRVVAKSAAVREHRNPWSRH